MWRELKFKVYSIKFIYIGPYLNPHIYTIVPTTNSYLSNILSLGTIWDCEPYTYHKIIRESNVDQLEDIELWYRKSKLCMCMHHIQRL